MKVEGPRSSSAVGAAKKASKAKKGGGPSFSSALGEPVEDVDAASGGVAAGPVGSLDSLLSLQEVGDATQEKGGGRDRQAREWGDSVLDRLEDIRNGLLIGGIPVDKLETLAATMKNQKENASDPALAAIIEEIELRALVELAKHHQR